MSSPDAHTSTPSVVFTPEVDPEPQHRYEPGGYHPVIVGEIYNQRYEVIRKLGWGVYSTLWLVRDTQNQSMAALKVLVAILSDKEENRIWDELGMLKVIQQRNPQSDGYRHVCQLLDNFTHQGPNGNHTCLVLEVMQLNVLNLNVAFSKVMPMPLLARLSKHLLRALAYLHDECDIIHTDIKGDNILMEGSPPESTITLGEDDLRHATFKLSDFGAANTISDRAGGLIQPESLRAPEVLIGAEWDTKADIWNLGCLIGEFATGWSLFNPHYQAEENQLSPVETHLAQIVSINCGDFHPEFLARGSKSNLYFDDKGSLLRGAGIFSTSLIELVVPALLARYSMEVDDIAVFIDFLNHTLVIDPKSRSTARALLGHPWIADVV